MNAMETLMKLSSRKLEAVRALIESPAADEALARKEAALKVERQRARDDLARVTGPHKAPIQAARERYAAALARREAAQQELNASLLEEREAMQLFFAEQYEEGRSIRRIEQQLVDTSDPRIGRFAFLMDCADDAARAAFSFWATGIKNALAFNLDQVQAARSLIVSVRAECEAMLTMPLTHDEVTARLISFCERLEAPLAELQLNPPQIGRDGEVAAPLPWGAKPGSWRVEEVIHQPRQPKPLPKAGPKELFTPKKRGGDHV